MATKLDTNWQLSPATVSSGIDIHDLNFVNIDRTSIIWLTPSANINFTGLTGGEAGRIMFIGLRAGGAFTITLQAENAGSAAANRFTNAVTFNMSTGTLVTAWIYLGSRWRRWK